MNDLIRTVDCRHDASVLDRVRRSSIDRHSDGGSFHMPPHIAARRPSECEVAVELCGQLVRRLVDVPALGVAVPLGQSGRSVHQEPQVVPGCIASARNAAPAASRAVRRPQC